MDEQDSGTAVALIAVALSLSLVLALVLGLALRQQRLAAAPLPALQAAGAMPSTPDPQAPNASLQFAAGAAQLLPGAAGLLENLAIEARSTGLRVIIQAYAEGQGLALAAQRADALAHALESHGVARQQLMPMPPQPLPGKDASERVDIWLR